MVPVTSLGLLLGGSGYLFWGSFPASWLLGPFRLSSTFKALEALRAFMALLAGHALFSMDMHPHFTPLL